uniref:Uncharacterized protein n=1 Tax=Oryza barthii TaxID=65489 RepID=A0A0D3H3N9_9ORYZ
MPSVRCLEEMAAYNNTLNSPKPKAWENLAKKMFTKCRKKCWPKIPSGFGSNFFGTYQVQLCVSHELPQAVIDPSNFVRVNRTSARKRGNFE